MIATVAEFAKTLIHPFARTPIDELATWTAINQAAALRDGWGLFETENGLQLQAWDDMDVFELDQDAWLHVLGRSAIGGTLETKALRILREQAPVEFKAINDYNHRTRNSELAVSLINGVAK